MHIWTAFALHALQFCREGPDCCLADHAMMSLHINNNVAHSNHIYLSVQRSRTCGRHGSHSWLVDQDEKKCVLKNSYQNNDSYSHYCVHIRTEQYTVPLNIQSKVSVNFGSWCMKIKIKYTLFKNKVFKHGHLSINSILSKQYFWNQISKNWQNMIINVLFCIPQKLVVVNGDLTIACSEHQYIYFLIL